MIKKKRAFLSKTKYIEGLQCPKLLWYEYNRKELIPPPDPSTQAVFNDGAMIGELAHTLFPGGIRLERSQFPEDQDKKSHEALKERRPLFEAGFIADRGYALADVLVPVYGNGWDLIEVKSSTSVKEEHLPDVAFQLHVYRNAGIDVRSCALMHINNKYLRKGEIDPRELFVKEDVTVNTEQLLPSIKRNIPKFLDIISCLDEPKVMIGPQCEAPYACPLKGLCWADIPRKDSVFSLYRGKALAFELMAKGIISLRAIPEGVKLNEKQKIQLACHANGAPRVYRAGLRAFLKKLKYPLYFLDFETVGAGLPLYDLSRPYEQIPFQYSLHIAAKPGAALKQYSFIAQDAQDPRPEVLRQLRDLLGDGGSIVAYNAAFEIGALERSAEIYTEYADWVKAIKERVVDLLDPFRAFHFYHPRQEGSNSLKAVLPALTSVSYKEMEIAEGSQASREYARVTFTRGVSMEDRNKIYEALESYCALDTRGMIDIVEALRKSCG